MTAYAHRPADFPVETMGDDWMSRHGAERLKSLIEAYWKSRGYQVSVSLHNAGFHPAIRAARFDVRSDMCNGWPTKTPKPKPEIVSSNEDE